MPSSRYLAAVCLVLALLAPAGARAQAPVTASRVARISAANTLPAAAAKPAHRAKLNQIVALIVQKKTADAQATWQAFATAYFTRSTKGDLEPVVDWILRESILKRDAQLLRGARVADFQAWRKAAVESYLSELRTKQKALSRGKTTVRMLQLAAKTQVGSRPVLPKGQKQVDAPQLASLISEWEEMLKTVGDDAQLANIDLQNMLQKQQQTIQMLSNISKVLHDTALAVIRKIG